MLFVLQKRLDAARNALPALETAVIDEVLRIVPGKRAVLAGRWRERAVVFRLAEPQEVERQAREWLELNRIRPAMQTGRDRVAEPLLWLPEAGLMVLERVTGQPLLEHLWRCDPRQRETCLRPAAEWLRRYTESTESWTAGNAAGWLARAERAAAQQPFARLRASESIILQHLRGIASALEGADWRVAICHGDFHPNNLILGQNRLTGIDTGGSARLPVCKDIARFLVHMGRRGMIPSGQRQLGVDASGIAIFSEVFSLTETERRFWLPFFIGVEALIRVERKDIKKGRLQHAAEMYATLAEDMAHLPG
jgi:hypothetical protein